MAKNGQGWHGDSKGHAKAAQGQSAADKSGGIVGKIKNVFTDPNTSKESDGQGWHGDSKGHAKAARKAQE